MTGGQRDLVRYRMERAVETLQEARLMLENGHLHGAANRIYCGDVAEPTEEDLRADLEKAQEFITQIQSLLGSI